jgi:hypothetical protein
MANSTYTLEAPLFGMTAYNASSFQLKADATASSYIANTTGKIYFTAEFAATLAGITVNLNAPPVISIEAKLNFKAEWKDGEFQFSETVAKNEAAKATATLNKTKSILTDLKAKMTDIEANVTELNNHADTVSLYGALMEA